MLSRSVQLESVLLHSRCRLPTFLTLGDNLLLRREIQRLLHAELTTRLCRDKNCQPQRASRLSMAVESNSTMSFLSSTKCVFEPNPRSKPELKYSIRTNF